MSVTGDIMVLVLAIGFVAIYCLVRQLGKFADDSGQPKKENIDMDEEL